MRRKNKKSNAKQQKKRKGMGLPDICRCRVTKSSIQENKKSQRQENHSWEYGETPTGIGIRLVNPKGIQQDKANPRVA